MEYEEIILSCILADGFDRLIKLSAACVQLQRWIPLTIRHTSYLSRIILRDFLGVEHGNISLIPGVNILQGPNGLGKSSFLKAIAFSCMPVTKRAVKLPKELAQFDVKLFIRKAADVKRATVSVELVAKDCVSSQPPVVTVTRTVTKQGRSTFKLNNRTIRPADLDEALLQMDVDLASPLQYVFQENAQASATLTIRHRLSLVLQALVGGRELSDMKVDIKRQTANRAKLSQDTTALEQEYKSKSEELAVLQSQYSRACEFAAMSTELKELRTLLHWRRFEVAHNDYRSLTRENADTTTARDHAAADLEDAQQARDEAAIALRDAQAEAQRVSALMGEQVRAMRGARGELQSIESALRRYDDEVAEGVNLGRSTEGLESVEAIEEKVITLSKEAKRIQKTLEVQKDKKRELDEGLVAAMEEHRQAEEEAAELRRKATQLHQSVQRAYASQLIHARAAFNTAFPDAAEATIVSILKGDKLTLGPADDQQVFPPLPCKVR
ncbi:STRUCTURAL MAINTENANCE OF CHROMOSOMES PROTEIN 5 [Carpediemonas membranifera]|uniref:Structural maintenance of chromosomes protein 5 n=1 Tax=Carpediemonas membranifera TaxID=201153 RepID=A0A8J6BHN6_9EUKA|nr:STRUCTURAL MAINTENANCE OF CHROMOSOMES PROTEIN 5 [Carpediemonas membranifera]|eukprot:KAG9397692.1 STRUCTURAL MAINTENANCE OF CHROMOSOMES PROTEIN 5 [Carpediemonas membranifera]